jgi:fused signal recognition particle receptor
MFKFLKEKLKQGISLFSKKIEEEGEEEVIEAPKEFREEKKEKEKIWTKEKTEEIEKEGIIEEPKKEGFFAKLFKKKEKEEEKAEIQKEQPGIIEEKKEEKKPEEIVKKEEKKIPLPEEKKEILPKSEEKKEEAKKERIARPKITREEALGLIKRYNQDISDLNHYLESEAIMGALAKKLGEDEHTYAMLGLLHDVDWGITKSNFKEHLTKAPEILRKAGLDEDFIEVVLAHGYGFDCAGLQSRKRSRKIEHALSCSETVTGLIHAYALMRGTIDGMEANGLMKKFKDKRFAAAINREIIKECELIGLPLNDFLALSIEAVKSIADEVGLRQIRREPIQETKTEEAKIEKKEEIIAETKEIPEKAEETEKYAQAQETEERAFEEEILEEEKIFEPEKPSEKGAEKEVPPPEEEPEKRGFWSRLTEKIVTKKISADKFEKMFWDLELAMLENNVAVEVIEKIKSDLKDELVDKPIRRNKIEETIVFALKDSIDEILSSPKIDLFEKMRHKKPFIICFVGVNGSGKTTTIAKIAKMMLDKNKKVVLAAADTFRAAAIDQLQIHADSLNVKMIKHDYGSDPAAVAFDAIKYAEAKDIDAVLIDTAGRLHSNTNLIDEMKKIIRVAKPDLKIFVGEAITGNDCIEQAKQFNNAIGIDGIILAKQDVDEKGGASISVSYITKKPILYIGTGQKYSDLREFDKEEIIKSLGLEA